MNIKTGDKVLVIAGKDKGKKGNVTQVFPKLEKVVIENVNKMVKHLKSRQANQPGQRIEFFGPIHVSNVLLICPNCGKATRTGHEISGDEKVRTCKKCKKSIK